MPSSNLHKKGEHVFNDIAGASKTVLQSALASSATKHFIAGGVVTLGSLSRTTKYLNRLRNDPILKEALTIVSPATGASDDPNSTTFGRAKLKLEKTLSKGVLTAAKLAWQKQHRPDSSFHDYEAIVTNIQQLKTLKRLARSDFDALIAAGHDAVAEKDALEEKVSGTEVAYRRSTIENMKQHRASLRLVCHSMVESFFDELETSFEQRVAATRADPDRED